MSTYQVTNPATGETTKTYDTHTDDEIRVAQERSHEAFKTWRETELSERTATLKRIAEAFRERAEELAEIISEEMGKSIPEGIGEAEFSGAIFDYYADNAEALLADEPLRAAEPANAVIRRKPLGSLLGIMPWNFPYYQVARFVAPNLALGNTILLKHASSCPRSAEVMEEIFHAAGVPEDVYINIRATSDQVAEIIIADPRNQGVSLTGSERAGMSVAATAGKHLKKVVLELGGSDPYLLLSSDDLDETVDTFIKTRLRNVGQACNSPKRMIIVEHLYDEFVEKATAKLQERIPEDPTAEGSTLRPLSSKAAAETFVSQIDTAREQGATVLAGGAAYDRPGAWVQPALLVDVDSSMDAYSDEIFGPALMVFKAKDEAEAIRLANDTPFGLGAAVFSTDTEQAKRVADQIETGMVFVNTPESSREYLPFGGVKRSGIGRELGPLAMDEFVNKQLVYIDAQ